jgi:aminopeptidase N
MVFGAAKFAVQYLKKFDCIPIETWVYPQDREKGFFDFEPAEKIIKLFTKLIGPFPYEKLANVESKTKYGGMENASNIFYSEREVTGTRSSEVTVAHEIAHQWFGDAVSEEDWDHIWLSEGFATFFQNVFTGYEFGQDSLIHALERERQLVIRYDEFNPDSPIVDTTVINLNRLLNINSYQKGAWVLRMLQHVLGEKTFWNGIRLYYKTYRNKNALTNDFEKIMEEASSKDLSWFFKEWLYKPGLPYFDWKWNYNSKRKSLILSLEQTQPYKNVFKMPIDIAIYSKDNSKPKIETIVVDKKENSFNLKLDFVPVKIIFDPGTWVLMREDMRKQ